MPVVVVDSWCKLNEAAAKVVRIFWENITALVLLEKVEVTSKYEYESNILIKDFHCTTLNRGNDDNDVVNNMCQEQMYCIRVTYWLQQAPARKSSFSSLIQIKDQLNHPPAIFNIYQFSLTKERSKSFLALFPILGYTYFANYGSVFILLPTVNIKWMTTMSLIYKRCTHLVSSGFDLERGDKDTMISLQIVMKIIHFNQTK